MVTGPASAFSGMAWAAVSACRLVTPGTTRTRTPGRRAAMRSVLSYSDGSPQTISATDPAPGWAAIVACQTRAMASCQSFTAPR